MTTVLLTGVGGSIGCHVLEFILRTTKWSVVGIDSFRHKGLTDRVDIIIKKNKAWPKRLRVFTHDLTAPISSVLSKKIGPVNYIINLASLSDVEASIQDPARFILNNVQIVTTMLDYARTQDLSAFVQISTDEVYGPSGEDHCHPEWSPILPSNPYAASKAAQEAIAIAYWRSYNVPVIITNTMNNFGEMQQPGKFPAMLQAKISRGDTVLVHGNVQTIGSRYYLHSANFADALMFILKRTVPYLHQNGLADRPDRYNVVGEKRVNNLRLAEHVAAILGKPLKYVLVDFHTARPGHDRHYGLDGAKLAKLGWRPVESFLRALARTIQWTKKHPEWME